MRKFFFIALTLALPAFFLSCNESKYKAERKTIDSLKVVLDSVQLKMGQVDTVMFTNEYKEYLANISLLKEYFNDKKEDSTWQIMTSYGAVRVSLKSFAKNYPEFYSELACSRKKLDSLKGDIEAGNLEKEKIREYTKNEADAVINLKTLVGTAIKSAKTGLKLLDSLNPKVIRLIKQLKKEKKSGDNKTLSEEEDD